MNSQLGAGFDPAVAPRGRVHEVPRAVIKLYTNLRCFLSLLSESHNCGVTSVGAKADLRPAEGRPKVGLLKGSTQTSPQRPT